jgi:hypothetical protein
VNEKSESHLFFDLSVTSTHAMSSYHPSFPIHRKTSEADERDLRGNFFPAIYSVRSFSLTCITPQNQLVIAR